MSTVSAGDTVQVFIHQGPASIPFTDWKASTTGNFGADNITFYDTLVDGASNILRGRCRVFYNARKPLAPPFFRIWYTASGGATTGNFRGRDEPVGLIIWE